MTEQLDDEGVRTVPASTPTGDSSAPATGATPEPPVADRDTPEDDLGEASGDDPDHDPDDDYELDDQPVMEPGGG
ncbi:hypothetical protein KR546_18785, partial [Nitriliruptoria bacterium AS10]